MYIHDDLLKQAEESANEPKRQWGTGGLIGAAVGGGVGAYTGYKTAPLFMPSTMQALQQQISENKNGIKGVWDITSNVLKTHDAPAAVRWGSAGLTGLKKGILGAGIGMGIGGMIQEKEPKTAFYDPEFLEKEAFIAPLSNLGTRMMGGIKNSWGNFKGTNFKNAKNVHEQNVATNAGADVIQKSQEAMDQARKARNRIRTGVGVGAASLGVMGAGNLLGKADQFLGDNSTNHKEMTMMRQANVHEVLDEMLKEAGMKEKVENAKKWSGEQWEAVKGFGQTLAGKNVEEARDARKNLVMGARSARKEKGIEGQNPETKELDDAFMQNLNKYKQRKQDSLKEKGKQMRENVKAEEARTKKNRMIAGSVAGAYGVGYMHGRPSEEQLAFEQLDRLEKTAENWRQNSIDWAKGLKNDVSEYAGEKYDDAVRYAKDTLYNASGYPADQSAALAKYLPGESLAADIARARMSERNKARMILGGTAGVGMGGAYGAGYMHGRPSEEQLAFEQLDRLEKTANWASNMWNSTKQFGKNVWGGEARAAQKAYQDAAENYRGARKTYRNTQNDFDAAMNNPNTTNKEMFDLEERGIKDDKARQIAKANRREAFTNAKSKQEITNAARMQAGIGGAAVLGTVGTGYAMSKRDKEASEVEDTMNELYKEAAAAILQEEIPQVKKHIDPIDRITFPKKTKK